MNPSPRKAAIFGLTHPIAKRVLAIIAIALLTLLFFAFVGGLFERALRATPSFQSLLLVEGQFVSHGQCGGKGDLWGFDLVLRQGAALKSVRVPCTEAFSSLQPGTPLAVHFREVEPLLSWPPFIEVWHATSAGKVLYSYSALASRVADTRWMVYAVAFGTLFVVGLLVLFLCNCAWREAECVHHGESSPPIKR